MFLSKGDIHLTMTNPPRFYPPLRVSLPEVIHSQKIPTFDLSINSIFNGVMITK